VADHAGIGHVNLSTDFDGLIRHISLSETAGVRAPVPHLMELAYRDVTGHPSSAFRSDGDQVLLPFVRSMGAFPTVPFASVLNGEVPKAFLRDKIVLVGATATGNGDRYPTPCPAAPPCRG
jgi:CHASE2 domain-containing sensor protein